MQPVEETTAPYPCRCPGVNMQVFGVLGGVLVQCSSQVALATCSRAPRRSRACSSRTPAVVVAATISAARPPDLARAGQPSLEGRPGGVELPLLAARTNPFSISRHEHHPSTQPFCWLRRITTCIGSSRPGLFPPSTLALFPSCLPACHSLPHSPAGFSSSAAPSSASPSRFCSCSFSCIFASLAHTTICPFSRPWLFDFRHVKSTTVFAISFILFLLRQICLRRLLQSSSA